MASGCRTACPAPYSADASRLVHARRRRRQTAAPSHRQTAVAAGTLPKRPVAVCASPQPILLPSAPGVAGESVTPFFFFPLLCHLLLAMIDPYTPPPPKKRPTGVPPSQQQRPTTHTPSCSRSALVLINPPSPSLFFLLWVALVCWHSYLVVVGSTVSVYSAATSEAVGECRHDARVNSACFAGGKGGLGAGAVATCADDKTIRFFRTEGGTLLVGRRQARSSLTLTLSLHGARTRSVSSVLADAYRRFEESFRRVLKVDSWGGVDKT